MPKPPEQASMTHSAVGRTDVDYGGQTGFPPAHLRRARKRQFGGPTVASNQNRDAQIVEAETDEGSVANEGASI